MSYEKIKARVDRLKRDATKAEGALEQLLVQLKKEFNCETIEQAKEHLKELQEQVEQEQEALEIQLTRFEKKWASVLEDVNA